MAYRDRQDLDRPRQCGNPDCLFCFMAHSVGYFDEFLTSQAVGFSDWYGVAGTGTGEVTGPPDDAFPPYLTSDTSRSSSPVSMVWIDETPNPDIWSDLPYLTSDTSWYVSDEAAAFFSRDPDAVVRNRDPDALALQTVAAVDSDPAIPVESRPQRTWEEFCAEVDRLTEIQRRRRE